MDKWASNINKLCTAVTPYTYILIAVAFIVIGVMCAIPSEESRQKGKKSLPWVILGALLILGTIYTAKWITGQIAF